MWTSCLGITSFWYPCRYLPRQASKCDPSAGSCRALLIVASVSLCMGGGNNLIFGSVPDGGIALKDITSLRHLWFPIGLWTLGRVPGPDDLPLQISFPNRQAIYHHLSDESVISAVCLVRPVVGSSLAIVAIEVAWSIPSRHMMRWCSGGVCSSK